MSLKMLKICNKKNKNLLPYYAFFQAVQNPLLTFVAYLWESYELLRMPFLFVCYFFFTHKLIDLLLSSWYCFLFFNCRIFITFFILLTDSYSFDHSLKCANKVLLISHQLYIHKLFGALVALCILLFLSLCL